MSRKQRSRAKRSSAPQPGSRKANAQNKPASPRSPGTKNQAEGRRSRRFFPLLLLVFVTLAAYLNAWPDNLTFDDKVFAASERFAGLGLGDIGRFFTEDLWAASGTKTGLYRPLLLLSLAMDTFVYGDWAAGFHLSNIVLHLLVTILVYGFIRYLLLVKGGQSPLSDHIALLAAAIFGVHPVHTEVVNSIFNRSGLLVTLGVIGSLWWFLRTVDSSPLKAWSGLAIVYLLVLFSKESGAILPALAVSMLWIFTPGSWRYHLRKSIPVLWLLIPLGIYLGLRANALDVPDLPVASSAPETLQIKSVVDSSLFFAWGRVLPAIGVWFDSLRIVVWPHPLLLYHSGSSTNAWLALVLQLTLVIMAILMLRQKRYGLFTGLTFFYIAMLPASRIIGESGGYPHLAERYIYLPSVGLAIALAFGLKWLTQQFNFRTSMFSVLIALVILTPITWARNAEWASDVLLYESEYRQNRQRGMILHLLVGAHLRQKNYSRALEICDRHTAKMKKMENFSNRCGLVYGQVGRIDDAERSFLLALNKQEIKASTHNNLANMYLHLGRRSDAQKHFELAVDTERNSALREYRKSYMLTKLYPSDRARLLEAKTHLEQALQLQPQLVAARQLLQQLNEKLGSD